MESVRASAPLLNVPTTADDAGVPLDHERLNARSWHHFGTTSESGAPDVSEAPDFDGDPSRTRTLDPLIKSHFGGDRIGQHRAESAAITGLSRSWAIAILRVA
jgi:hypothetical protein